MKPNYEPLSLFSCPNCGRLYLKGAFGSFIRTFDEHATCGHIRFADELKSEVTIIDGSFLDRSGGAGAKQREESAEAVAVIASRNIFLDEGRIYAGHDLYSSTADRYRE